MSKGVPLTIICNYCYLNVAIHSIDNVLSVALNTPGNFHAYNTIDLKYTSYKISGDCSNLLNTSINRKGKLRDKIRDI